MDIFFLFLLSLTVGVLSTLFWIPEKSLGRGYFQMNALIALGLLSLAAAVVVLGAVVVFSGILCLFNFLVDVSYTFLDPRVRLHDTDSL